MAFGVLIVDDQQLFRDGMRDLLKQRSDVQVVGEAVDGRTAVNMALELSPTFILMNVILPGLSGPDATCQIIADNPDIKILAFTRISDEKLASRMLGAGAYGYLVKEANKDELMLAIDSLVRNEVYLSPGLSGAILKNISSGSPESSAKNYSNLTKREREVLQLLTEGGTTKSVAALLYVSSKTIETHRKHIMDKLNLRSIAKLTKFAIREGLTSVDY